MIPRLRELLNMREGRHLVLTNGVFDILHPGHLETLETAATLGDLLFVAVNSDASVRRLKGEGRPVNPIEHRLAMLHGLRTKLVAFEFDYHTDTALQVVGALQPEVYVKGDDYRKVETPEYLEVKRYGGRVVYTAVDEQYSTTKIVERMGAR